MIPIPAYNRETNKMKTFNVKFFPHLYIAYIRTSGMTADNILK